MNKPQLKEIYYELVRRIKEQGQSTPKRHGEYVSLHVFDNYSLQLDTWSKSICVYESGKHKDSLGIDFGGFSCNITMVKFWLAHIPNI